MSWMWWLWAFWLMADRRGRSRNKLEHCNVESASVIRLPHGLQSPGHALRIAVLAAPADLRAPGDRVPGGFGPFNL